MAASSEGEHADVVGTRVDEIFTSDLVNDVQTWSKELRAKVPPKGNVHLAMVVHKHGEALVSQGLIVEVATLLVVDKGKGIHSQVRSTQRLTIIKHLFKPNLEKVKELPKATFKLLKGTVIQRPLALLVGAGKEVKMCYPISLQPQIGIVNAFSFILIM